MAISRASLSALIAANIADNTSEAITPALHRAVENALNDSLVNWVDDVKTSLNDDNNEVPTSGAVADIIGTTAVPFVPKLYSLALTNADLVAGGFFDITGKPPSGYRYHVLNCHFVYNFDTTAMNVGFVFEVQMENAARAIFTSKSGTFGTETTSFNGQMMAIEPTADQSQYTNDKIQVNVTAASAGDGDIVVYVIAMLIPEL
jgi:hypothetical protein